MSLAPLILFVYNRLEHTRLTIEALLKNKLAAESELFIFSDQAKNNLNIETVAEVRHFIKGIAGFKSITVIEREENYGLARNIIEGVTEIIQKYGRVIVLEDDLITSPFFLQFMNDALRVYENEPKVAHIQGFCYDIPNLPETFLTQWIGSWGWATWQRAWKFFERDGDVLLKRIATSEKISRDFDFNARYTRMLKHQTEGKNNSWAIRWHAVCFLNDMLALNSGRSLIQNIGFDGSGTNCEIDNQFDNEVFAKPVKVKKIEPIVKNMDVHRKISIYNKKRNSLQSKIKTYLQNSSFHSIVNLFK